MGAVTNFILHCHPSVLTLTVNREVDLYIAQVSLDNVLVLSNLCEYRHKSYIALKN